MKGRLAVVTRRSVFLAGGPSLTFLRLRAVKQNRRWALLEYAFDDDKNFYVEMRGVPVFSSFAPSIA